MTCRDTWLLILLGAVAGAMLGFALGSGLVQMAQSYPNALKGTVIPDEVWGRNWVLPLR